MSKKAIILGGGFAGCTAANFLKQKGIDVKIYEKSNLLGGGCRTFFYNGHPYTLGPHHLLIDIEDTYVYDYMAKYLDLRKMDHYNMSYVAQDEAFYTFPIHKDEVDLMPDKSKIHSELEDLPDSGVAKNFDEFWRWSIGDTLYNKFMNGYSKKMWKIKNNTQLDEFTFSFKNKREDALKTGSKKCFDGKKNVYYPTEYEGYNSYFDTCVDGCAVYLNTPVEKFDINNKKVYVQGEWQHADIIVNTLSLDLIYDYHFGELPYVGRDFLKIILPIEKITPYPYLFIHYAGDEPYTRIFEYKLLTQYKSPHTMLGIETPSNNNKLYPYPVLSEVEKANKYIGLMPDDVYTIGRMGKYHYDNMDMIIKDCFKLFSEI